MCFLVHLPCQMVLWVPTLLCAGHYSFDRLVQGALQLLLVVVRALLPLPSCFGEECLHIMDVLPGRTDRQRYVGLPILPVPTFIMCGRFGAAGRHISALLINRSSGIERTSLLLI